MAGEQLVELPRCPELREIGISDTQNADWATRARPKADRKCL